jgi:hypothetical protein
MFILYIAITAALIADAAPAVKHQLTTELYICADYLECA